jgi:DNA-binding XRE family transcriptional regulator
MANKKKYEEKEKLMNHLQGYRIWKGLRQCDLSAATKISISTIREIERNNYTPKITLRIKLADFFGIREKQLFYKDAEKLIKIAKVLPTISSIEL